jgi:thiamine pyrophosphate-dependent acetolactate synthase large subunit-like protein
VIDVRDERNTVFAADAMARCTGIPGVAIVTAGPGLTNTITSVKNCQMAQTPVILIGGATSDLLKGRGSLQDIDQAALLKPHVKWMKHIARVEEIVPSLEQAFQIAQSGVPGPVFLEVPLDVLYSEVRKQLCKCNKQTHLSSLLPHSRKLAINSMPVRKRNRPSTRPPARPDH